MSDTQLLCNRCTREFEPIEKAYTTRCGHIFCHKCATHAFSDSGIKTCQCPVCEEEIVKEGLIRVTLPPGSSAERKVLAQRMYGSSPALIMQMCLDAIEFFSSQKEMITEHRSAVQAENIKRFQAQCSQKLNEQKQTYENAKRKYQQVIQEKASLLQETEELKEKYRQKAKQCQELERRFAEIQGSHDNSRKLAVGGGGGGGGGGMMFAHNSPLSHRSGELGPQLITTMHRTTLLGPQGNRITPENSFGSGGMGGRVIGGGGGGSMGLSPLIQNMGGQMGMRSNGVQMGMRGTGGGGGNNSLPQQIINGDRLRMGSGGGGKGGGLGGNQLQMRPLDNQGINAMGQQMRRTF